MGDVFFVLKCFAITLALIVLMQIRIAGRTIEHRTEAWIQTSSLVDNFRMAAEGAVKVADEGYDSFASFAHKHVGGLFSEAEASAGAAFDRAGHEQSTSASHKERRRARNSDSSSAGPMGPEID